MNSLLKISQKLRVKRRFKTFSPQAHNLPFRNIYLPLKSMFSPSLLEIRGDYYKASDFILVFPCFLTYFRGFGAEIERNYKYCIPQYYQGGIR